MNILKIKNEIYESIQKGDISDKPLKLLIIDKNNVIGKECELWDFKFTFSDSKDSYLKLVKLIASFHNSYGGYIFYGVQEVIKDTNMEVVGVEKNIINNQKLRGQLDKFFGRRIDFTYIDIEINISGSFLNIGVLHIPKRGVKEPPLIPNSDGATSTNEKILTRDAIYIRTDDQSKQTLSFDDFTFISGDRIPSYVENFTFSRKKLIEHNLPDKSQICPIFIGRIEIIRELWSWLSNDLQYTKVLAADGGKGKTSVAYEFSRLIVESGSELFDQIIWLTAKSKQFKANYNEYIQMPEIHYSDVNTLLHQICLRTGSLPEEMEELNSHQLQRIAKENLQIYRYLIIIDDVDSNNPDDQRRIMEIARTIANTSSRVLLTTRVNNMYSSDYSIVLPGLVGDEYKRLIQEHCRLLGLPDYNDKNINKLQEISEGSPLFTESILRLCKLGLSLEDAINEWKGKSGDAVRIAALRKEVKELTQEAIKVLVTISIVGVCSRTELRQYTDLENHELDLAMEGLGSLFLIKSTGFIESEPRFETSSSISKLVISISEEILPNATEFLARIDEISDGLNDNAKIKPNNSDVGKAIRQCNSLIKDSRFEEAKKTIKELLKKPRFKENSDLYFMMAKIQYEDPSASPDLIRQAFTDAYLKKQKKPFFFEMWYQTESKFGTSSSLHDVCKYALQHINTNDLQWCERYAMSCYNLAVNARSENNELKYYTDCYENINILIRNVKGNKKNEYIDLSRRLIDKMWQLSNQLGKHDISSAIAMNAIKFGDIRSSTFNKLIDASRILSTRSSINADIVMKKNELLASLQKSIVMLRSGPSPRNELADQLSAAYDVLNDD